MRKASKKITSSFLAAAMLIPTFGLPVAAAEPTDTPVAEQEYKIYPTPQSIVYAEGTTEITSDVNIVYGESIDQYTKDHAEDVFALLGDDVKLTASNDVVEGKTNVLVGIKGDESKADQYFDTHTVNAADLFENTDAYALEIGDGTIAVLGVHTDAAYHGLTSLQHIFTQVSDKTVRNLRMEDFADVKTRGFIEGYYGNPWSMEDRADLMTFGGNYKMNGYFYAPKDDPKHNSKWRELYTEEELEGHRMIAEAGNKAKCYYIYALHPFMHNAITFGSNYETDLNAIKAKFEQMMQAGVKQFAILADDASVPSGGASSYVRLMTDLTNWIESKQSEYPGLKKDMIFCPNDYMGYGSSSQMQGLKDLPESVSIIQTGGRVWGQVGPDFNDRFYANMGRPAFMWINWPCSDNTKDGLIMGGAETVMKPNTRPEIVDGIVLNPMQQSEPSKQGLFTNADYAWNIWDKAEHYDDVWHDSFNYIDHGTIYDTPGSVAYRELSKHMKNSQQLNNEESEEIKDMLNDFKTKLANGTDVTAEEIKAIRDEFVKLHDAAITYRNETGNERTLGQIHYWIDAWEETANAVIGYMDTLTALNNNAPLSEVWDHFSEAQNNRKASTKHGFKYVDHTEYARPGRRHVTPFMNSIGQTIANRVNAMVDPSTDETTFITSRGDTPVGDVKNVFDKDSSTQITFQTPNTLSTGDFVGATWLQPKDLDEVQFLLGSSSNPRDTFQSAKVQISYDGKTWEDYGTEVYNLPSDVHLTDMNVKGAKGVRLLSTADKDNTWLVVRDININPNQGSTEEPGGEFTKTLSLQSGLSWYQSYTDGKLQDGNLSTFAWTNGKPVAGPLLTWNFSQPVQVFDIHLANGSEDHGDKITKFSLEYTEDGTTWKTINTYEGTPKGIDDITENLNGLMVKGVRVNCLEAVDVWVRFAEFTCELGSTKEYDQSHLITNQKNSNAVVKYTLDGCMMKGEDDADITLAPGEYIGVDLGAIQAISSLVKGTDNADVTFELSRNNYEWTEVEADAGTITPSRYARLINKTDADVTFNLNPDFAVMVDVVREPYLLSDTVGITDGNWAGEDSRDNGAAFDGDVDTTTEFATLPVAGKEIIYDLGQMRKISKLEMFCQDSATNYLRDAKVQISADKETWTDVFEIGDGIENTDEEDANTSALDSDAGYTASSLYPNKVSKSGTLETAQDARYIRIYITADNDNRAILFNEIVINDGEFVPVPDYAATATAIETQGHGPKNVVDKNLDTTWATADTKAGSFQYDFSEKLDANAVNVITAGEVSNAKAEARIVTKDGEIKWVTLGNLDHTLEGFEVPEATKILSVKFTWAENKAPEIAEIIRYTKDIDTPVEPDRPVAAMLKLVIDQTEKDIASLISDTLQGALNTARELYNTVETEEEAVEAAKDLNAELIRGRFEPSPEKLEEYLSTH